MRLFTRSPFSLGLICGAASSLCWGLFVACEMGDGLPEWAAPLRPMAGWTALIFPGILLCLPGIAAERLRLWPVRWAVGAISLSLATALFPLFGVGGHCRPDITSLPALVAFSICFPWLLLPALFLCMGSNRTATDAVAAALLFGLGLVPLGLAARGLMYFGFFADNWTADALWLTMLGPWLGVSMWSFGTAGRRKKAEADA